MMPARLVGHDDRPVGDTIIVLENATWADFERLLEMRGERRFPRLAYLDGELELMTASQPHESLKSFLGRLVEVWCEDRGVEFSPYGSWLIKDKRRKCGLEPDECYVLGEVPNHRRPDLAIEVVWTSGGIGKLDIYRALEVREVWIWKRGRITVHALSGRGGERRYREISGSRALPGIDLAQLVSFLGIFPASRAIREYRAALAATK